MNNDFDSATYIALDCQNPDLTLHNRYDEDYFGLDISADSVCLLRMYQSDRQANADMQVYADDRLPLASHLGWGGVGTLDAGSFYVRVYSPDRDVTSYGLDLLARDATVPPVPDPRESNETYLDATVLGVVLSDPFATLDLNLHSAGDEDWFSFEVWTTQATYHVDAAFFQNRMDLELILYGQNGSQVLATGQRGTNRESISFIFPLTGTYHLRVYSPAGETGQYALSVVGEP